MSGGHACSRYPLRVDPSLSDDRVAEAYRAAVAQTLDRLAAAGGRPATMQPFDGLLRGGERFEDLARSDRPVVGTFCNFVPDELVIAAGAIPLRLDLGQTETGLLGARVLPADICPAVRSIMGGHLAGLPGFRAADLLVIPTACDGKKKLVRALGDQRDVFMMQLPQDKEGPRAKEHWIAEVSALAERLETLTGRRIRRQELREAILLRNRCSELLRELNDWRAANPGALSGRDAFLVMQTSFVADPRWWAERVSGLLEELRRRPAVTGSHPTRILLTGSPILFPDYRLLQTIEENGSAVVVADEMCSGTERLYHPTVLDEWTRRGMLRAVAERTLLPCTCPCFVSSDDRIDRLLERARRARAQGIIHHTLRLCQLYDMDLPRVTSATKAHGLPLLNIYLEHSSEDAVIRNRVEAFLEMLQQ
jgi:benzoyl-CoA reductase/2-hydroxyglutaryl-CoA dehydratase subunit BcrC/BadD/HgdB